jgi:hypothetical protein
LGILSGILFVSPGESLALSRSVGIEVVSVVNRLHQSHLFHTLL